MIKLAIKDLAKKTICDGNLYLSNKEGRKFFLMQPGMFIDEEFIKKHAQLNSVFDFESVVDQKIIESFAKSLKELRYLQFEKDLRFKTAEIVSLFNDVFSSNAHFLSFALVCYQEFSLVPKEHLSRMHSLDMHLFRKSIYSAAYSVIIALANDFYHYTMIRDFYNLTLTLDIGLCDSSYSYYVARACNQENQVPGTGLEWMKEQKASVQEVNVFFNHPKKSYEFIKSLNILAYPELSEITLYQHELSRGKGFPRGISKGQVSSWEAVVILADSLVEIQDSFQFEKEVVNHLLHFTNAKLDEIPVQRVHFKLSSALLFFEQLKEQVS